MYLNSDIPPKAVLMREATTTRLSRSDAENLLTKILLLPQEGLCHDIQERSPTNELWEREPPDAHQILLWVSLPTTKVEKVSTDASDLQF